MSVIAGVAGVDDVGAKSYHSLCSISSVRNIPNIIGWTAHLGGSNANKLQKGVRSFTNIEREQSKEKQMKERKRN